MATLKTLLASLVVLDEEDDAAHALAVLRPHAEKLGAGPDGFAWYEPAKHDRYSARAIVKQLAIGLSSQKIATFLVGKNLTVGFVPWADKLTIKAQAKAAKSLVVAIGPTKPAKVRRAKAPPANLKRMHVKQDVVRYPKGFDADLAVHDDTRSTGELALSTWPPKYHARVEMLGLRVARAADGRILALGVTVPDPKQPRPPTLRLRDGQAERILDEAVPASLLDAFAIDEVGFVGDDLVLLPSESSYRGGNVKRPLVLRARSKQFVELVELPVVTVAKFTPKKFPPFCVHGFARTGNGDDVLLWRDAGYVGGTTYKRVYDLGTRTPRRFTSAPGSGASFFVSNDETIVEIRAGAKPAKRLAKAGRIMSIAAGPEGVVLAAIIRAQPKLPIMVAWWPETREWAAIPGAMLGFKPSVWFSQGHIGFNATSKLVWGFDPISDDLRAVEWSAVAALPRTPE